MLRLRSATWSTSSQAEMGIENVELKIWNWQCGSDSPSNLTVPHVAYVYGCVHTHFVSGFPRRTGLLFYLSTKVYKIGILYDNAVFIAAPQLGWRKTWQIVISYLAIYYIVQCNLWSCSCDTKDLVNETPQFDLTHHLAIRDHRLIDSELQQ